MKVNQGKSSWSNALRKARRPVQSNLCKLALLCARNPWSTVTISCLFTFILLVAGILTNITFESKDDVLFTPFKSLPSAHQNWIDEESDFSPTPREINILLHSRGDNIMEDCRGSVTKAFDVWEAIQDLPKYSSVCADGIQMKCPWSSITQFFDNSRNVFDSNNFQSNEDCINSISDLVFPNGDFVSRNKIFGNSIYDDNTSLLIYAESTLHILGLPFDEDARKTVEAIEADSVDALFKVEDGWKMYSHNSTSAVTVLEQFNESSFSLEFRKGFLENIPFLIAAFTLMTLFTAGVFYRRHSVESRMGLGLGAVVTVTLGMSASFGLLFICGVPITSIHGMIPFIIVGIGLDDTFIIVNEFDRHPRTLPIEDRISKTINEIGLSIVTTTVTSAVAFGLGCISSIPAVYWLCLYAFPAIISVFIFSVTMLIAIIVIEERRIDRNRFDMICCIAANKDKRNVATHEDSSQTAANSDNVLMVKYANLLLNPVVKMIVLVVFTALFIVCTWSTTQLQQQFSVELVLPKGSYVVTFQDSLLSYSNIGGFQADLVFRGIDQSSVESQVAMEKYVNDMVAMKEISNQPDNFWLRDFQVFLQNNSTLEPLPFEDQITIFLDLPIFYAKYKDDIARNDQGQVTASRVQVKYDQVDKDDVEAQIKALENQMRISKKQSINSGIVGENWSFFSIDRIYFIWSFFKACPEELTLSTITGVVAVTLVTLLTIPHWSAVFFSAPLIIVLYIDLLGILQFFGVTINSISYITLVVSIGLMVDFLIHILLRYFESSEVRRGDKVKDTLKTMGISVAIGGFTTFLGVLPLAFNTTGIFEVVFITFLGLVLLGVSHGLILLPVILSILGPEDDIVSSNMEEEISIDGEH